jgi:hypothetical protein
MDCSQADILLVDYLYGELSEQQRQAFELHLQSCPAHAKEVERSRAVLTVMRSDRREDPSDSVSKEIVQRAEESINRTSRPWNWFGWIRTPIAAAAALLVVIGIGVVIYVSEEFERRSLESASTVTTEQPSSPKSLPESDATPAVVADTGSVVSKDERTKVSEKTEPALKKTPAPQKPAERPSGADEKALRLSREPLSEKPKARDEEIAQKVDIDKPSDRAFTPRPEEYRDQNADSAGSATVEKSTVAAVRKETAMQPAATAPPLDRGEEIPAEGKQVPRSMPSENIADKSMDDKLDTALSPLSDSDVMAVMRAHRDEFSVCVQKYPSVKDKMVVSFVIANDGVVSSVATLTEEFKGTAYEECVRSEIQKIRFPQFGGEPKTVRFPFTVK